MYFSSRHSSIPISRISFLHYRIQFQEITKSSTKLFCHRTFGLVVNIYTFKQLLTNVYFEVFCDRSAIVTILNGKKKLPPQRIQKLIEDLLPFNFTVQYLHIADILSRLAGKDLEPSDQLIPISFNVNTRSTRLLKLYNADKHKISEHIPYMTKTITPKTKHSKTKVAHTKPANPPKVHPYTPKPTTSTKTPPVPIGILWKSFPPKLPPPQKELRKSLVNPNLKIPQTLPPLDLPNKRNSRNIQTTR